MAMGVAGGILALANLAPGESVALYDLFQAGEIDKGTFEAAGFKFEPDTWRPGRGGCCHLHIRPGNTATDNPE